MSGTSGWNGKRDRNSDCSLSSYLVSFVRRCNTSWSLALCTKRGFHCKERRMKLTDRGLQSFIFARSFESSTGANETRRCSEADDRGVQTRPEHRCLTLRWIDIPFHPFPSPSTVTLAEYNHDEDWGFRGRDVVSESIAAIVTADWTGSSPYPSLQSWIFDSIRDSVFT